MPSSKIPAGPDAHAEAAPVIDLNAVRERRRLTRYRERAQAVLAQNREALQRLFDTGLVFTRHGSRVGRELLQAHQHLLRVVDMASRSGSGADLVDERAALFSEIEELLEKSRAIARRNRSLFQSTTLGF
jgi:hypothetical protein